MAIKETIEVKADTSQAKASFTELGATMTGSMLKAQVGFAAAQKALSVVGDMMGNAIGMALEYEKTNQKLTNALRDQGHEVERNRIALNRSSSELQKLTGHSDEVIRNMHSMAIAFGVMPGESEKFVKAAVRLSNVTGRDANESMKQLLKTLSGLQGEIGESVPEIRNMTAEQLKAGKAADVINDAFREQLSLLTEGTGGALKGLTNAWDDTLENMGRLVTEESSFVGAIRSITEALNTTADALETIRNLGIGTTIAGTLSEIFASNLNMLTGGAFEGEISGMMDQLTERLTGGATGRGGSTGGGGSSGGVGKSGRGGSGKGGGGGGRGGVLDFSGAEISDADVFGSDLFGGRLGNVGILTEAFLRNQEALHAGWQEIDKRNLETRAEIWEKGLQEKADKQKEADDNEKEQKKDQEAELARIEREAAAARRQREEEEMALKAMMFEKAGAVVNDFAMVGVEALLDAAEGQDVAFDKVVKGFLRSTGTRLIGQGLSDILTGTSRALFSYGSDVTGLGLAGIGAAEVAAGTAMAAGSLAIQVPKDGGAGGSSLASGAASMNNREPTVRDADVNNQPINITVIGNIDERAAMTLQRGINDASRRGFRPL